MKRLCFVFSVFVCILPATIAFALDSAIQLQQAWNSYFAVNADVIATKSQFPYQSCFEAASSKYDIPVTLLLAVARGESDFNARAISHANAMGVMQIRWPQTAKHLGITEKRRLFEPCVNIDAGARYLVELLSTFKDPHLAILAYNRGPGTVQKAIRRGTVNNNIWYSNYIYDHLSFVIGREKKPTTKKVPYKDTGRLPIIAFSTPFRARALVKHLSIIAPEFQFDWFKKGRIYQVSFHFENAQERARGVRILQRHAIIKS